MSCTSRVLLALGLLSITGCGGSDAPTGVEGEAPLASGSIGEAGGELAAEGVLLTVPPGAFGQETEIRIYGGEGNPIQQGGGGVYRFQGLPEQLGAAATLRLYHGSRRAGAMLFLGEERASTNGVRDVSWYECPSQDSSGWCVGRLGRGPYELEAKSSPKLQATVAVGMERARSSAGHFEVVYDPGMLTGGHAQLLAGYMESGYDSVYALGFHFGEQDTIWPRPLYFRELSEVNGIDPRALYTVAPYGKGHFSMDPVALDFPEAQRPILRHEVFHCGQQYYDPRPPEEWKTLPPNRIWLDEAAASWIEVRDYPGSDVTPFGMVPANATVGLWQLDYRGTRIPIFAYGYGMSTFIKYIVETQGRGRLREIYDAFVFTDNALDCFLEVLDPPLEECLPEYHRRLATAEIHETELVEASFRQWATSGELIGGEVDSIRYVMSIENYSAAEPQFAISDERDPAAEALRVVATYDPHTSSDDPPDLHLFFVGLAPGETPDLLAAGREALLVNDLPAHLGRYDRFLLLGSKAAGTPPGQAAWDNWSTPSTAPPSAIIWRSPSCGEPTIPGRYGATSPAPAAAAVRRPYAA